MMIRMHNYNNVLVEVSFFQLIQWKSCINLEAQGMKHSRGSVTAHVRRILDCPRNFPRDKILAHLTAVVDDILEQRIEQAQELIDDDVRAMTEH